MKIKRSEAEKLEKQMERDRTERNKERNGAEGARLRKSSELRVREQIRVIEKQKKKEKKRVERNEERKYLCNETQLFKKERKAKNEVNTFFF